MITAVSLNPSVDQSLEIASLREGGLNRVLKSRRDAGGKGINVALALAALGEEAGCVGFLWRDNGAPFRERLQGAGVVSEFVELPGSVRTNIKLLDRKSGIITEINEPGSPVGETEIRSVLTLIGSRAESSDLIALSGSVPPGCAEDIYARIIASVRGKCAVLLDADGDRLALGVREKPDIIKPNRFELEKLVGRTLPSLADVIDAAKEIASGGVRVVLVSLGRGGAAAVSGTECWYAPSIDVPVRSTVAAGDSMVAGFAAGYAAGEALSNCLAMGIASASAKCQTAGTEPLSREVFASLLRDAAVKRM